MNVLLLTSHSIAEYDDLRMLTDLGYDVFSIGAYTDPCHPTDDKRPPLADPVPYHSDFADLCVVQREKHGDEDARFVIDWAKGDLHPEIIEWADVIIVHHFPEAWIGGQWNAIRHKRVIWRTCGQSDPRLEQRMMEYRHDGLQVVRYSPAEKRAFHPLGMWAGEDAVIRFGKYPGDYRPYTGDVVAIGNVTQNMAQRGEACGYDRWKTITHGLPTQPAGPGSEALGGLGELSYEEMLDYLGHIRTYLYLGTQPASYTLGLMEAMFSGVPIMQDKWETPFDHQWLGKLWEANDILTNQSKMAREAVRTNLGIFLKDADYARHCGELDRQRALELFDVAVVGPQWKAFLG